MTAPGRNVDKSARWLHLLFFAMCLVALLHGVRATHDLTWPYDIDHFRDIAQAQTIQDGYFFSDHHYRGETIWYNPLAAALVAGLSWSTGMPAYVVHARCGAYLNLLAPIAFYGFVAYYFDRRVALASAAFFLFFPKICWAWATYSPWLFPAYFAQTFFFVTLIVYRWANKRGGWWRQVILGVSWGVAFLAHTGPALILGVVMLLNTVHLQISGARSGRLPRWQPLRGFLISVAAALITSLPYSASLIGHYHLNVVNRQVTSPVWIALRFDEPTREMVGEIPTGVVLSGLAIFLAGMAAAMVYLIRSPLKFEWSVPILVGVVCVSYIPYTYFYQILDLRGISLPSLINVNHFILYLSAMLHLWFGVALVAVCQYAATWMARATGKPANARRMDIVLISAAVALMAICYPLYQVRKDFVEHRSTALAHESHGLRTVVEWIREHTNADDVFATEGTYPGYAVWAAGRKIVSVGAFFSNPYVDWDARNSANRQIFAGLRDGDVARVEPVVRDYHLSYICSPRNTAAAIEQGGKRVLRPRLRHRDIVIHQMAIQGQE